MKVTLVCLEWPSALHSGGVARYAYRLATGLSKLVDLTVVTTVSGIDLAGVNIVRVPESKSRFGRYYISPFHVRSALTRIESDIVHSFGDDWMLARSHAPLVRTFFGSSWSEAKSSRGLRRLNHAVLAITEKVSQKRSASRIAIAPESEQLFGCQYLMPPVTAVPTPLDRKASASPSVVFVGSYSGRKRGYLVQQAVLEASRILGQDVRLHVVGPEADKANWDASATHVSGASDAEVQRLISSAWVLMAPSHYEGFGIPAFEALSLGVPVIASSNPGSRYLAELTNYSDAVTIVDRDEFLVAKLLERLRGGPRISEVQRTEARAAVAKIVESASPNRLVREIYSPLISR